MIDIDRVIHVLSIEDNPVEAALIRERLMGVQLLGWNLPHFEIEHVDRLEAALARLEDEGFDVVLSDLDLPDSQAGETVAKLREHIPNMPLVVLTGREDEALAHKSARAGVQDYVYKSEATSSLLARSMMYAIERQQAHAKLEQGVEERTAELEQVNVNLRQANQALEAEIAIRKRVEKALRESESKYRNLVEQSLQGLVIAQANPLRISFASEPMEAITGLSPEEMEALNPRQLVGLIHPGDRERFFQKFRDRLRGEDVPPRDEYRLLHKSGEVRWIELYSSRVEFEGAPAVQGVFLDVTERKRAEETLRQRTAQLVALRKMRLELIAELDLDALLHSIVSQAIELLGGRAGGLDLYREDQDVLDLAVSIGIDSVPDNTVIKRGEGASGKVWETGEPLIVDGYQHWDGRADAWKGKILGNVVGVPICWGEEFLGVLLVEVEPSRALSPTDAELLSMFAAQAAIAVRNARLYERAQQEIKERKQAEEKLERYASELEARSEELDTFAHTVAHDLKNPLTYVIGFADTIKKEYATLSQGDLERYLDIIERSGRRANEIIDDLLLLAGARQMEVELQPLDMAEVVSKACERLFLEIEERQAEIILPDASKWPVVLGSPSWIEEVWVNYISNAIKFGGNHEESIPPRVEVGFERLADSHIRFWVRDNGIGLTTEEQERLFVPFTRLDRFDTKGHGLGLSIVQRIVEKLGGEIGVDSDVGRGSLFYFTLHTPASKPEEGGTDERRKPESRND